MKVIVELTRETIVRPTPSTGDGSVGAWVEFAGIVRGEEGGRPISALEYEAYGTMAERVMRDLLTELGEKLGCASAQVIHRIGIVPVGELAIWIGVASGHRKEALALVTEFMDRLKADVPIWKRRAIPK